MSLDNEWQDKLIRLGLVSDTLASAWGKNSKLADAYTDRLAARIAKEEKVSADVAKQKAKELVDAQRQANKEEELAGKREEAAKQLARDFIGVTKSAVSSAQAIYTSDKAFSSITPTVELMGNVLKGVTSAVTGLLSGIPIVSGISEAAKKAVETGTDITIQVANMMLQNAQTYVDTMTNLSKVGANFGGNMDDMMNAAHESGMSLSMFQKYIQDSSDKLRGIGGNMDQAAVRVAKMGQSAVANNENLLVLYGGFTGVSDALADFNSMLARAGVDTVKRSKDINEVSGQYLVSLKAIEEITGRSAKAQQDTIDKQMRNVAFQRRMAEETATYGAQAGAAIANTLQIVAAEGGDEAADYYAELAATGKILSETNLQYQAMHPAMARMIRDQEEQRKTYGRQKDGAEKMILAQSKVAEASAPTIRANEDLKKSIYGLAYVNDDTVNSIAKGGSSIQAGMAFTENFAKNARDTYAKLNADNGKSSKSSIAATKEQVKTQKAMDEVTRNSMPTMKDLVTTLSEIQVSLIETFGPKLTTAVDMFGEGIKTIAKQLGIVEKKTGSDALLKDIEGERVQTGTDMEGNAIWETHEGRKYKNSDIYKNAVGKTQTTGQRPGSSSNIKVSQSQLSAPVAQGGYGFNLKAGDVQREDGDLNPATIRAMGIIQSVLGDQFGTFTGLNDKHHAGDSHSDHSKGLGIDFTLAKSPVSESDAAGYIEIIKKALNEGGIKNANILDEYFDNGKYGPKTGNHFHASLKALAKGGIIEGTEYGTPVIAGENKKEEAITPLKNGMLPGMPELISSVNEMIDILKDNRDYSEKIHKAVA